MLAGLFSLVSDILVYRIYGILISLSTCIYIRINFPFSSKESDGEALKLQSKNLLLFGLYFLIQISIMIIVWSGFPSGYIVKYLSFSPEVFILTMLWSGKNSNLIYDYVFTSQKEFKRGRIFILLILLSITSIFILVNKENWGYVSLIIFLSPIIIYMVINYILQIKLRIISYINRIIGMLMLSIPIIDCFHKLTLHLRFEMLFIISAASLFILTYMLQTKKFSSLNDIS